MSLTQLELAITLTEIDCGQCGATYAINERYRAHCAEHGRTWHCPYCQTAWGYVKGALQAEKERHLATLARLNEANAARSKLEQQLKRVKSGVCPCCKRSFAQLQRHMKTKHPGFL